MIAFIIIPKSNLSVKYALKRQKSNANSVFIFRNYVFLENNENFTQTVRSVPIARNYVFFGNEESFTVTIPFYS